MWAGEAIHTYFQGVFCAKMTNTGRSERESASLLLKSYVPRAAQSYMFPMHLFVRQYGKLQLDRESEAGVALRLNLPVEKHASKVYTKAMFEQFGEAFYKSGAYELQEIDKRKVFLAEHIDAAAREKWCKVAYRVDVAEDMLFVHCECGMVYCRALKVMLEFKLRKIPVNI
nr:uncharacterized protein LOC127303988 [Lolium perenne]